MGENYYTSKRVCVHILCNVHTRNVNRHVGKRPKNRKKNALVAFTTVYIYVCAFDFDDSPGNAYFFVFYSPSSACLR